jgi:hypothetical protein
MQVKKTERRVGVPRKERRECKFCCVSFESYKHEYRSFCSLECYHKSMKGKSFPVERWVKFGKENRAWKGGRQRTYIGYISVPSPLHPNKDHHGCVSEHRLVMEKHIGRYLSKKEVVHHIDKNKENNLISNLMLFPDNVIHLRYHRVNPS